jgi:hypothetical protein
MLLKLVKWKSTTSNYSKICYGRNMWLGLGQSGAIYDWSRPDLPIGTYCSGLIFGFNDYQH